jgi:protoheme ferro-lyase
MNHINAITIHSQQLPEHLQKQVLDFICYLESRYSFPTTTKPSTDLTDADIEQACGILTAPHGVTLEQMDAAIKKRGGRL